MNINRAAFSFYGIRVSVESDNAAVVEAAQHDYAYFLSPAQSHCDLYIRHHFRKPDYASLPVITSSSLTPQNIVFRGENKTYFDYFGRAINISDRQKRTCDIYTEDQDIAQEIVYLSILSRVSELLDRRHIHRIHGLGLEYKKRGLLLVLSCKGGKTTLAMRILQDRHNGIRLLSDESPLIKSDGTLLPFPIRIGVVPENVPADIDPKYILKIKRMQEPPKVTIDTRCFKDRIATDEARPFVILLGRRSSASVSCIEPASKIAAMEYCGLYSVVGLGLYQWPVFVSKNRLSTIFSYARIFPSRIYNSLRLISRSKVFSFVMGRDIAKNYETLLGFLRESLPLRHAPPEAWHDEPNTQ